MKLLNKLAVLAFASAVILTGCQNNFSGTTLDTSSLKDAYSGDRTDQNLSITASVPAALSKAANQVIIITFANMQIDKDSISKAVTIYNLTAGSTANDVHGHGTAISYTVSSVDNNIATLALDLTGATNVIEVFADSTKLTACDGATKLDLDGDNVQGEANDDDYYIEFPVAGGSLTGVARNPRRSMFTVSGFTMIGVPSPATLTTYNTFQMTYNLAAADSTDYTTLFGNNLVIEKFDTASKSWTAITTTNTYNTTTGAFTASFTALTDGDVVRAKLVNKQSLKTSKEIAGFVQRYTMNNLDVTASIINVPMAAINTATTLSIGNQSTLFGTSVNVTSVATKNVEIEITLNTGAKLAITGDKGMDSATITTDNIKLFDSTNKMFVPFTITMDKTNGLVTKLTLILAPGYTRTTNSHILYLGPGLKTAGDTTPGINASKFGNPTNLDVASSISGFYGVTLPTSF